jgi:integrase
VKLSRDIKEYKVNDLRLFAISLSFMGVRFRKKGIKSKELAYSIAAKVRNDILNNTFDRTKYLKSDYNNTAFKVIINKAYFDYGRASNRPATRKLKDSLIKAWIIPHLGKVPISALDNDKMTTLYRKAEDKTGNKSVSKTISACLNAIFRDAYKLGLIDNKIKAPSVSYKAVKSQRFLSKQEVLLLIESNKHHQVSSIIATLYYLGLRISEACALQVQDYNQTFKTINISKTSHYGEIVENTKNKITALMKVPDKLIPFLDKQIEGKQPTDMIFHKHQRRSNTKRTITISTTNVMLKNACLNAGIDPTGITSHIFRRSVSQHLIESKVSPRSIAKYLRDKPATIMSHYASENTDEIRDMIDSF